MESLQSTPARLILGVWSGCPAMVIIWRNLLFFKVPRPYYYGRHFHEIVCPRRISELALPAKSRAFCCCLKIWLPIVCVVLDYCLCDQHMLYRHFMSAHSSTLSDKIQSIWLLPVVLTFHFLIVIHQGQYTNTCITVLQIFYQCMIS